MSVKIGAGGRAPHEDWRSLGFLLVVTITLLASGVGCAKTEPVDQPAVVAPPYGYEAMCEREPESILCPQ